MQLQFKGLCLMTRSTFLGQNWADAGLHVTSRRPCWRSRTKAFLSSGNQTLFSCKLFEKKFLSIDPQHGRLVTWLHQVRWFNQVSHLFSRYQRPLFRLVFGGLKKYQGKEARVCQQEIIISPITPKERYESILWRGKQSILVWETIH